jgi:hypothetical protein
MLNTITYSELLIEPTMCTFQYQYEHPKGAW